MKPIFVDTSALIALGNIRDVFHEPAERIRAELVKAQRIFLTTSLVVVELCNTFSNIGFRKIAIDTVSSIRKSDRWISMSLT